MIANSPRRYAAALLALSIAGGAALRLSGLDRRSISHPEMYVPGIRLPAGISEPAERTTAVQILTGTFSSDTHPPGYYLFMLPWTRVAGTSLTAMRLPSALLGVACIPLLFALGAAAIGPAAGAIAAALLAFNGYHIFWSQVARMFALDCFLGLASTLLLVQIVREPRRQPLRFTAYALLALAGVATHVFFWTLLATHMAWTFANAWGRRELPDFCRTQMLVLLLGCPLLAFAAYQSGTTVAVLSNHALRYLYYYLPFAFALPSFESGYFAGAIPFTGSALFWCARALFLLLACGLLLAGVGRMYREPSSAVLRKAASSPRLFGSACLAAAAVGTLEILYFVHKTQWLPPEQVHATLAATRRLAAMPGILALAAIAVDRYWGRLPSPGRWVRLVHGPRALLAMLGILPFAMLALVSQVQPLLNQRGMLFAAPYLLLLLAAGLVSLRKMWLAAAAPVLAMALAAGTLAYRNMTVDPADYREFAAAIQAEIQPQDVVFVRKAWYVTPILYYLNADRYRLVGRNYLEACARNPRARVWVVLLYDRFPSGPMQQALVSYRAVRTIERPHARAILYQAVPGPAERLISQTVEPRPVL